MFTFLAGGLISFITDKGACVLNLGRPYVGHFDIQMQLTTQKLSFISDLSASTSQEIHH